MPFPHLNEPDHLRIADAFQEALQKPFPPGAPPSARLGVGLEYALSADGSAARRQSPEVTLYCNPPPAHPSEVLLDVDINFLGRCIWHERPAVLMLGVVTITGSRQRKHLFLGAAALLDCLREGLHCVASVELGHSSAFELPPAEEIVQWALE